MKSMIPNTPVVNRYLLDMDSVTEDLRLRPAGDRLRVLTYGLSWRLQCVKREFSYLQNKATSIHKILCQTLDREISPLDGKCYQL